MCMSSCLYVYIYIYIYADMHMEINVYMFKANYNIQSPRGPKITITNLQSKSVQTCQNPH